jgi:hypothetical protein
LFYSKVKGVMASQSVDFSTAVKTALPDAIAEAFKNTDYTNFKEGIKGATEKGIQGGTATSSDKLKKTFTELIVGAVTSPLWYINQTKGAIQIMAKASGGLVNSGGLFLAGEAGVEVIQTSMGGANVTNAVQLEDVFTRAMLNMNGGMSGGDWTFVVQDESGNVRSSQVITAAERANRRDGRTIIPVGVY